MNLVKSEVNEKNLAYIEFSFDAQTVESEKAKAFRKNSSKFNIPGFRKGKAPRPIIEKMYGSGVFLEDAINELISSNYQEIINAAGRPVVSAPSFDIVSFEDDLIMKAEMYVKPIVEIGDYKGFEFDIVKPPVSDDEINAEIESVRQRQAREIEISDRPAQIGDTAVIDYEGSIDGVPFDGGKDNNHHLKLGSGTFIPGFEEQIVGKNTGDSFDVNVTFPEDYHAKELAGKPAVFKVKINSLSYDELPELDDDFAVEVSNFDTFADYRADIANKIEKRHSDSADSSLTEKIDAKLAEILVGEIPEAMVDNEIEDMIRDSESRMSINGLDFKTYLSYFGMTLDQYKANARSAASTRVKSRLALEKIAELENIEVSEESIEKEYDEIASRYNVEKEYARQNLPVDDVKETLKLRQAMEIVKSSSKVNYLDKEPEPETESQDNKENKNAD